MVTGGGVYFYCVQQLIYLHKFFGENIDCLPTKRFHTFNKSPVLNFPLITYYYVEDDIAPTPSHYYLV